MGREGTTAPDAPLASSFGQFPCWTAVTGLGEEMARGDIFLLRDNYRYVFFMDHLPHFRTL